MGQESVVEEGDKLRTCFEESVGLGFDVQVDYLPGLVGDLNEICRDVGQMLHEDLPGRTVEPRPVRKRTRRNSSVHAVGQQQREYSG